MTAQKQPDDCAQFEALMEQAFLESAEDMVWPTRDAHFVKAHRRSCTVCNAEYGALHFLTQDGPLEPLEAMDELTRRRWVNDILLRSTQEPQAEEDHVIVHGHRAQMKGRPTRRRFTRPMYGALVASLMLAGVAAFFGRHLFAPAMPERTTTEVLMVSGSAHSAEGPLRAGSLLRDGLELEVQAGEVALRIRGGIAVHMAAATRAKVVPTKGGGVGLALKTGSVLIATDGALAKGRFSVITVDGSVEIEGTIFSVHKNASWPASVGVLRGRVRIRGRNNTLNSVAADQTSVIGTTRILPMSAEERALGRQRAQQLDTLEDASEGVMLTVDSLPQGATVFLDENRLALTPLSVVVRPGHRRMRVEYLGVSYVQELLELWPGEPIERTFDLHEASEREVDEKADTPPARLKPRKAKPITQGGRHPTNPRHGTHKRNMGPPINTPTASVLLKQARDFRVAKQWPEAARSYEILIGAYPEMALKVAAAVALGEIQLLYLGAHSKALQSFRSYMRHAPHGAAAEIAAFGETRALRALGKRAEEKNALIQFLRAYPLAAQADRAIKRLNTLRAEAESTQQ